MVSANELIAVLKCDGWNLNQETIKNLLEGNDFSIQEATKNIINIDLKDIGIPSLHEDLIKGKKTSFPGPVILQVTKTRNVSAPKAFEESGGAPRMLKLSLTDGLNTVHGLEVQNIKTLSLKTAPGTKVRLNGKVPVNGGFLLLTPHNITVVGGIVQELYDKWNLSVNVSKYSRGVSTADGSGPPPWVPFGKHIIKNHIEIHKFKSLKDLEEKEKVDGEFENQRKQAVRELSKDGNLKIFGGGKQMLDANVQKVMNAGFSLDVAEWALTNSKNDPVKAIRELRAATIDPEYNNYWDDAKEKSTAGRRGRGDRGQGREKGKSGGPDDSDDDFDPPPNMPRPSGPASLFDFFDSKIVEKKEPVKFVDPVADVRGPAYNEMRRGNDHRGREKGYQKGHRNQRGCTSRGSIIDSVNPPDMNIGNWPAPGENKTTSPSTRSYLESKELMEKKEKQENSQKKPPMQIGSGSAREYFLKYNQTRGECSGIEDTMQSRNEQCARDSDDRIGSYARKGNIRRGDIDFHTQEIDRRRGYVGEKNRIMGKFTCNSSNKSFEDGRSIDSHYEEYKGGREKSTVGFISNVNYTDGNYSESFTSRHSIYRGTGNSSNGNRSRRVSSVHRGGRYYHNGKNLERYCDYDRNERGSNWDSGKCKRSTEYTAKELDMIQDFQQSMTMSGHYQDYNNMGGICGKNERSNDYSNFVGTLEFHRGGQSGGRRGRGSCY